MILFCGQSLLQSYNIRGKHLFLSQKARQVLGLALVISHTATPFRLACLRVPFLLCSSFKIQQPGLEPTQVLPNDTTPLHPAQATSFCSNPIEGTGTCLPYCGSGPSYIHYMVKPYTQPSRLPCSMTAKQLVLPSLRALICRST